MSSKPDGEWKYILCYRDHGTKICFLRPLATKTVRSVAWALLDIFSVIAPPVRLQTDNGREFQNIANAAAESGGGDAAADADGMSESTVPFFSCPLPRALTVESLISRLKSMILILKSLISTSKSLI